MYRVPKNLSQNFSLSKLKLALAVVSSGAALLAASPLAHAQQSQSQGCDAEQVLVAAPVQDASQATSTDSSGTPIVTGCARSLPQPAGYQPLSGQPLQCPAGTFLAATKVDDSSQATAVDEEGTSYFMSCAQPQASIATQSRQSTFVNPVPAPVIRPAPVVGPAPNLGGSAGDNVVSIGGRGGRGFGGGGFDGGGFGDGGSSSDGGGGSDGGSSSSGGGSGGSSSGGSSTGGGTAADPNQQAVKSALDQIQTNNKAIDQNTAKIQADQKLLAALPPGSIAAKQTRAEISALQGDNRKRQDENQGLSQLADGLAAKNKTLSAQKQFAFNNKTFLHNGKQLGGNKNFNIGALKANVNKTGGLFGNNKKFNVADLKGHLGAKPNKFGNFNGRFNNANAKGNSASNHTFSTLNGRFKTANLTGNHTFSTFNARFKNASLKGTAGHRTFNTFNGRLRTASSSGNIGTRNFSSFNQRRFVSVQRANFGPAHFAGSNRAQFSRARPQFRGFGGSSHVRFAGGGFRGGRHR